VPYELREAPAASVAEEPATELAPSLPRITAPRYSAAYRWGVPAAVVLAVVAWRAYEGTPEPAVPTPVAPVLTVSPPAPVVTTAASTDTLGVEPPPRRSSPAARAAAPQRSTPAEKPRAARGAAMDSERAEQGAPGEESRAPVRDAVALPPLRDVTRERPSRERTARPGFEQ
jgi:hypothetical protein